MRHVGLVVAGVGLLACGYVAGSLQILSPGPAVAQEAAEKGDAGGAASDVSEETRGKIKAAYNALRDAMEALQKDNKYIPATQDINAFLILSGGGNALDDLTSGRGVDPETFVGLYAGQALPEVEANLSREGGKLYYDKKPVQLMNRTRLQAMFALRSQLSGSATTAEPAAKK